MRHAWITRTGSTRAVGLLRIGLALCFWAEWAAKMRPSDRSSAAETLIAASFFVATTLMLFGVASRFSTVWSGLSALAFSIVHVMAGGRASHHVHFMLVECLLLALTPCGRSYSVDRWVAVRRAENRGQPPPDERGDLWAVRLMALQLAALYFWGGFHKLSSVGILSGERMQQMLMYRFFGSDPPFAGFGALTFLMATGSAALEILLAFGLWFSRPRRWLVAAGILFHGLIYVLFPVSTFSVTTILLYLAFFPPDTVHAALERLHAGAAQPPEADTRVA